MSFRCGLAAADRPLGFCDACSSRFTVRAAERSEYRGEQSRSELRGAGTPPRKSNPHLVPQLPCGAEHGLVFHESVDLGERHPARACDFVARVKVGRSGDEQDA